MLKPSACHSSQANRVIALGSQTDRVIPLGQISVTAQFYLENNRKIHPGGMRACRPKDTKRREREKKNKHTLAWERERETPGTLAPLFMLFPPPGSAICKLG